MRLRKTRSHRTWCVQLSDKASGPHQAASSTNDHTLPFRTVLYDDQELALEFTEMHNPESHPLLSEPDNTRRNAPIPSRWSRRWKATPYWYISFYNLLNIQTYTFQVDSSDSYCIYGCEFWLLTFKRQADPSSRSVGSRWLQGYKYTMQ